MAPTLFMLAKGIMAVGESVSIPVLLLTFNGAWVAAVRGFFDYLCQLVIIDIDR